MNLQEFLARRLALVPKDTARPHCLKCRKAALTCYCPDLVRITNKLRFLILMHPKEERRPIATGRMTHRCLANSQIIIGTHFNDNQEVRSLLADPSVFPMLLYPGAKSTNLSKLSLDERQSLLPADKEPVVIVLDGTWSQARKMLLYSELLQKVPRFSFSPRALSRFLVRKQPHAHCLSTIEAVHEVLTLFAQPQEKSPDQLLSVFDSMVAKQLAFNNRGKGRHSLHYLARKERRRKAREAKRLASAELFLGAETES